MSQRTDNKSASDVAFATIGARYSMPALAAVEAKAREIIEGDAGPKAVRERGKPKGDENSEPLTQRPERNDGDGGQGDVPDAAAASTVDIPQVPPTLHSKSSSEEPRNGRASQRKPTPPPFDPVVAHDANSTDDTAGSGSDPATVAERARVKRRNTEQAASVESQPGEKKSQAGSNDQRGAQTRSKKSAPPVPKAANKPPTPKPVDESLDNGPAWHEEIFDESWMSLEPRSAGYHAREDVRFLVKYCGVPRGGKILDVGCGVGRHAMEMASAGYHVVGIDRSRGYLTKAVEEANRTDLKIRFVEGDMRAFSLPPSFDAVTSLHTSFGYFSDRENLKALRCMASSLVPGGQLILDVVNRDWVASIGARRLWWEHRGFLVMEDVIFRDGTGRLEVERTVVGENSPRWDQKFQVRLYTVAEFADMFKTLGLELIDVTGNLAHPGVYLGSSNHRMILRARKPSE